MSKHPNPAHIAIAECEARLSKQGRSVVVITQNIDELHRKAGTKHLLEIHGKNPQPFFNISFAYPLCWFSSILKRKQCSLTETWKCNDWMLSHLFPFTRGKHLRRRSVPVPFCAGLKAAVGQCFIRKAVWGEELNIPLSLLKALIWHPPTAG